MDNILPQTLILNSLTNSMALGSQVLQMFQISVVRHYTATSADQNISLSYSENTSGAHLLSKKEQLSAYNNKREISNRPHFR